MNKAALMRGMKVALASSLLLVAVSAAVYSQGGSAPRQLQARGDGIEVKLALKRASGLSPEEGRSFWGSDEVSPEIIRSFHITRKGKTLWVWRSAYADLSNVGALTIVKVKGQVYVKLVGGDADTGYVAMIAVGAEHVVRRVVRSGEFPDHDYEETRYVVRVLPDP